MSTIDFRDDTIEWLEADGLGGYASGTASGKRTRRYHALLLTAATPPTGRSVLVSGLDAEVSTAAGRFPISSQVYEPGVIHPDGLNRLESFEPDPWPRWRFRLPDGTVIEQEIFVRRGAPVTVLTWRLAAGRPGTSLEVRPFLAGRDYHALHHENQAFNFEAEQNRGRIVWRPYPGVPEIHTLTNGTYEPRPAWYRRFLYSEERARGLDCVEDLAAPGFFRFALGPGSKEAILILSAGVDGVPLPAGDAETVLKRSRSAERRRRRAFPSRLHRAAEDYIVRRGSGLTVIAGYPWFADWGRDTFISLRGLCLATGRLDEARDILFEWAGSASEGFPTAFRIKVTSPSTTPWIPPSGTSSRSAISLGPASGSGAPYRPATGGSLPQPSTGVSRRTPRGPVTGSGSMMTGFWPPANRGFSSPGWMPRWATGSSRPGSGNRSRYRRYG